jgi:high-affinity K+ transport system ATPase subunit B
MNREFTGESAPVIREAGGDRSAVAGGKGEIREPFDQLLAVGIKTVVITGDSR